MAGKQEAIWKHFFYSKWFLVAMLFLIVVMLSSYARAYYQEYLVKQEIKNLQEEVHSLESKKLETVEILKYVQSDAFVEEKARTELNLLKPGEKMAVIAEDSLKKDNGQLEDKVVKWSSLQNPIKWIKFFFFKNINN